MKKTLFGLLVAGFFVLAGSAFAQVGMMGWYPQNNSGADASVLTQNASMESALQEIYKTQNITSSAKVDCSKVTDVQFEKLGDAYMGLMLPNESQHEVMDNMMGGEGSESLTEAHINMGRSYLGCWSNYNSGPVFMPMMGASYSTNYPSGGAMHGYGWGWNMMGGGFGGYSWFGIITMLFLWTLLILGIIALVKWVNKK